MLPFDKLSFWERNYYTDSIDFAVIGSGIVGLTFAIQLKQKYKQAKIIVLERGYLPSGASTKNAGFACFGSPSEIIDDLSKMNQKSVWETVALRIEGLNKLLELSGKSNIGYQQSHSWELFENNNSSISNDQLSFLNEQLFKITKINDVYSFDSNAIKKNQLTNFSCAIKNKLEGSISTDLLMDRLIHLANKLNIKILNGINVKKFNTFQNNVEIITNYGSLNCHKLVICTNGFAKELIQDVNVNPSRAQVLITKPIGNLKLKGTFHSQKGFYYLRNINQRILLGGGRCLDFEGESTDEFDNSEIIKNDLTQYLKKHFLQSEKIEIDYFWSGIMGTGFEKKPIVKQINNNVYCGVRLGGMGIAIGTEIGNQLVKLITNE